MALMLNICNPQQVKNSIRTQNHLALNEFGFHSILIIDPDRVHQFILETNLNNSGINLDFANDKSESLEKINHKYYSLIFIHIPILFDEAKNLIEKIRTLKSHKVIPIIGFTHLAIEDVRNVLMDVGLCDLVQRPFNPLPILQFYLGI